MANDSNRRTVLKLVGASAALGFVSTPVTASDAGDGTGRVSTHVHAPLDERRLGYDVRVTSRVDGRRAVSVSVRKVTPGTENPTVFSETYSVAGGDLVKNDIPGRLGTPGMFEVVVEVDDGRTRTVNWWVPAERVPPNQGIDVKVGRDVVVNPHIT
jgi:hypothetical protein